MSLSAAWDWKPTVIAGCIALVVVHLWPSGFRITRRTACWNAAVLIIFLALVSPFEALGDTYLFSFHMAKHLLFVLVVPALLWMGAPPLALPCRLHPAAAWLAGIGVMAFWHIPAVFNTALANEPLHIFEHLSLLAGGAIYWAPILAPQPEWRLRPVPHAVTYLFTSCAACTTMGVLITFAPHLLYPEYTNPPDLYGALPMIRGRWGISAAMDQQIGGLLMWVPGCAVYLTAIMAMFARWYGEEQATPVEA